MGPTHFGVGAGFPRPCLWSKRWGGENPPLQCWAHYLFQVPLVRAARGYDAGAG
jgi:hypothetical protein